MTRTSVLMTLACAATLVLARPLAAQHEHAMMGAGRDSMTAPVPRQAGQAAFAALQEVVRLLEADPNTDWSKVNLEALRQHLIDMDDVTMRSRIAQRDIPGGFTADVTGTARTVGAIRRMLVAHAHMMNMTAAYHMDAVEIPGGARVTVTAHDPADAAAVTRLRGLGMVGVLVEGDHHPRHHMMLARGQSMEHEP
ncbi:MAG TPA: hypothetical protein VMV51_01785 [Gemmatimonadaceae bacterium]|nr:hypothetical protein [Gemmatimonadaceae bacterium]